MKFKLLLDQGLPRSAAKLLRDVGRDAIHTAECDLAASTDEEILDYASRDERIVVTLDADFHAILALRHVVAPSVIRIRIEGLRVEALVDLIQRVLLHCDVELAGGAMVSVTDDRIRVRKLPV